MLVCTAAYCTAFETQETDKRGRADRSNQEQELANFTYNVPEAVKLDMRSKKPVLSHLVRLMQTDLRPRNNRTSESLLSIDCCRSSKYTKPVASLSRHTWRSPSAKKSYYIEAA